MVWLVFPPVTYLSVCVCVCVCVCVRRMDMRLKLLPTTERWPLWKDSKKQRVKQAGGCVCVCVCGCVAQV